VDCKLLITEVRAGNAY